MLADTLAAAGIPEGRVEVVVSEVDAIEHALASAGRGDLVVICADALERGWKQIEGFGAAARATGRPPVGAGDTPDAGVPGGPAPRASHAGHTVPHDAPADDAAPPPRAATGPAAILAPNDGDGDGAHVVPRGMVRETRGVVLAPEASD
jgi:hypothetical protein